jgi:hypothetical protein
MELTPNRVLLRSIPISKKFVARINQTEFHAISLHALPRIINNLCYSVWGKGMVVGFSR